MQELKDISNVVGVLNYGPFEGASRKKLIVIQVLGTVVFLGIIALVITFLSISQIRNPDSIEEFILYIFACVAIFLWPPILFLIMLIKNETMRKKVQLWLEDAVIVKAQSKNADRLYQFGVSCPKIQVNFVIDGVQYNRQSKSIGTKTNKQGYHHFWSKYADREITIAYSPKYDEVMILNDKKIKQA
ncbi:MAG: hypothetical protein K2N84_05530 [Clostridia bacterium]|nr:hypothetical protein [Clostridia bacterium]